MRGCTDGHPTGRLELLRWTARIGAVTAEALAEQQCSSVASARARLSAGERRGLLAQSRLLTGQPALYTITRAGLRACGMRGLVPAHVSAANATHSAACAFVAAALGRRYPEHRVIGEPELRMQERLLGRPLASARIDSRALGAGALHRPDLVLWPLSPGDGLPVAVEVELAVKAPRRLLAICRGWARCREVAGVLYLASPAAERALGRAIEAAQAGDAIALLAISALVSGGHPGRAPSQRTIPSEA
ncbi:MAG TPA: hypothetical protein VN772_00430 [Solirubrobacteraceae bacterium]|nr:hypothetical protein [Solirubrobacteraceae bacterium]